MRTFRPEASATSGDLSETAVFWNPKNNQKGNCLCKCELISDIQYSPFLLILIIYSYIINKYFLDLPGARMCGVPAPSSCSICMTLDCFTFGRKKSLLCWTPSNILNSNCYINLGFIGHPRDEKLSRFQKVLLASGDPPQKAFMPGSHPWGDGAVAWPWDVPAAIKNWSILTQSWSKEHLSDDNEYDALWCIVVLVFFRFLGCHNLPICCHWVSAEWLVFLSVVFSSWAW